MCRAPNLRPIQICIRPPRGILFFFQIFLFCRKQVLTHIIVCTVFGKIWSSLHLTRWNIIHYAYISLQFRVKSCLHPNITAREIPLRIKSNEIHLLELCFALYLQTNHFFSETPVLICLFLTSSLIFQSFGYDFDLLIFDANFKFLTPILIYVDAALRW